MRILIATGIFSPDIGGPASYAQKLAQKLGAQHKVAIVTYSPVLKYAGDIGLAFPVFRIWQKIPKGVRHLFYFFRVWYLAGQYDAIYALNAVSAGLPALLAARLRKKKFFVKIVGDYAWETAMNKGKTFFLINDFQKEQRRGMVNILHILQSWVCKQAHMVIVPSSYLSGLVRGWGVSPDKITVIYNGVNFKSADMSKEDARRQIGISGNLIISIGRLVPWKGFRMLIKVMPQLLAINQFFRLIIIGDGPEMEKLKTIVKNLNLDKKVYLVGRKSHQEMAVYMAAADMFVLNTGYEGFSHQLLEAMSAGVPIITTPVGGNREVIQQSENGFMIKYNDEFNLVEAVKSLWAMPDVREKFITEGKKTASKYTVEKMFSETIKTLTSE